MEDAKFLTAYAKVIDDKEYGVYIQDVYFGGVSSTYDEAKLIANDCINNSKSGSILPKIIPMENVSCTLEVMAKVVEQFQKIENDMIESENIIIRSSKKRHK